MKYRGKFNKTAGFKLNNMTLEEKKGKYARNSGIIQKKGLDSMAFGGLI